MEMCPGSKNARGRSCANVGPVILHSDATLGSFPSLLLNSTILLGNARPHPSAIDFNARDFDRRLVRRLPLAMRLRFRIVLALREQILSDRLCDPQYFHGDDLDLRNLASCVVHPTVLANEDWQATRLLGDCRIVSIQMRAASTRRGLAQEV